jgi:hypothetical protein
VSFTTTFTIHHQLPTSPPHQSSSNWQRRRRNNKHVQQASTSATIGNNKHRHQASMVIFISRCYHSLVLSQVALVTLTIQSCPNLSCAFRLAQVETPLVTTSPDVVACLTLDNHILSCGYLSIKTLAQDFIVATQ